MANSDNTLTEEPLMLRFIVNDEFSLSFFDDSILVVLLRLLPICVCVCVSLPSPGNWGWSNAMLITDSARNAGDTLHAYIHTHTHTVQSVRGHLLLSACTVHV